MGVPRPTEKGFQKAVIGAAQLYSWKVCHYAPTRVVRKGVAVHFTPVVGDPGGPDLLLARGGKVLAVELKSDTGWVRPDQRAWAAELGACYRCWRPAMWDDILAELRGGWREGEGMIHTRASCGCPVPAVGATGSMARRAVESRPCDRFRCRSGLPAKFSEAECEAYCRLRDMGLTFLVDRATKAVYTRTGDAETVHSGLTVLLASLTAPDRRDRP